MKNVYTAGDELEAQFVQGLLEAEQIPASVHNQLLQVVRGSVPFSETYPSVWVRDEDLERAERVVQEYREGKHRREAGPRWQCSGCGEWIEGQFTHCWRCGTGQGDGGGPVSAIPVDGLTLDYESSVDDERFAHEGLPGPEDLPDEEAADADGDEDNDDDAPAQRPA
jgi:hypothetical protein